MAACGPVKNSKFAVYNTLLEQLHVIDYPRRLFFSFHIDRVCLRESARPFEQVPPPPSYLPSSTAGCLFPTTGYPLGAVTRPSSVRGALHFSFHHRISSFMSSWCPVLSVRTWCWRHETAVRQPEIPRHVTCLSEVLSQFSRRADIVPDARHFSRYTRIRVTWKS